MVLTHWWAATRLLNKLNKSEWKLGENGTESVLLHDCLSLFHFCVYVCTRSRYKIIFYSGAQSECHHLILIPGLSAMAHQVPENGQTDASVGLSSSVCSGASEVTL